MSFIIEEGPFFLYKSYSRNTIQYKETRRHQKHVAMKTEMEMGKRRPLGGIS